MTRFPIATQTNLFAALIYRENRHVTGKKTGEKYFKKNTSIIIIIHAEWRGFDI